MVMRVVLSLPPILNSIFGLPASANLGHFYLFFCLSSDGGSAKPLFSAWAMCLFFPFFPFHIQSKMVSVSFYFMLLSALSNLDFLSLKRIPPSFLRRAERSRFVSSTCVILTPSSSRTRLRQAKHNSMRNTTAWNRKLRITLHDGGE
ncbi:hypothetical protein IE53DRAFT_272600 [Violaceomyces palustris]|uniref:Uncharacterized protein n=1 Tax=Violaceomyces palustris TaxID=1673888 RepID=A0ACD0NMR9_9BASI|nr:hypothetical protein IE53DRAFT_272600 [Violaceomyces palustris]